MKKNILIILIPFLIWGCSSGRSCLNKADNLIIDDFNREKGKSVFVISEGFKGNFWFKYHYESIESVLSMPKIPGRIFQVLISPSDEFLAVISAEEGHPILYVFKADDIFNDEIDRVNLIYSLNPYPGHVWIKGWKSSSEIILSTNMDLNKDDELRDNFDEDFENPREYILDLVSGEILKSD